MRAVLDTNVLVSGLLSPHGATGRLVDLLLAGQFTILADDRILSEYAEVLRRPKFGFRPDDVADMVSYLRAGAEGVTAGPVGVARPDPTDLPFLEVAVAGRADALVTGNTRDYQPVSGRHDVPVMSPAEFLARLGRAG